MEPEMTERLRKKIFDEESKPVQWNKDLVWTKLNRAGSAKKLPIYRIAAAIAFVMMLGYCGLQFLNEPESDQKIVKEEQPDLLPEVTNNSPVTSRKETQNVSGTEENNTQIKSQHVSVTETHAPLDSDTDSLVLPLNAMAIIIGDTAQIPKPILDEPEPRKVQAIVGVVPDADARVQVTIVKKGIIHVDLFNIEEATAEPSGNEAKSITARIK